MKSAEKEILNSRMIWGTERLLHPPQYSFHIPSVYCLEILDCFPQMRLIRITLFSRNSTKVTWKSTFFYKPAKCWHFLCVFMWAVNVISQVTAVTWGPCHDCCKRSRGKSSIKEANSDQCIVSTVQPFTLCNTFPSALHCDVLQMAITLCPTFTYFTTLPNPPWTNKPRSHHYMGS